MVEKGTKQDVGGSMSPNGINVSPGFLLVKEQTSKVGPPIKKFKPFKNEQGPRMLDVPEFYSNKSCSHFTIEHIINNVVNGYD